MLVKIGRRTLVFITLLALLCLLACVATYARHLYLLKNQIENNFNSRHEMFSKFVSLQLDRMAVMESLFQESYTQPFAPLDATLLHHPPENIWQLIPLEPVYGTFTGVGPITPALERELRAAQRLDIQIKAALQVDGDVSWLYYLSAQQFIYIAPAIDIANFHFSPKLYERRYWLNLGPLANPERELIVQGPFEDIAGKGPIVTFAQPVYVDDQFMGMIGLDISLSILKTLMRMEKSVGESLVVDDHQQLIAREFAHSLTVSVPQLADSAVHWHKGLSGNYWLTLPLVQNGLWLAHRLAPLDLYLAAARASVGIWFVIVLTTLLAVLSLRLQKSLAQVTLLTRIDPLTQALNRRGFFEAAEMSISLARRKQLSVALLLLDIDYFKKINDTYGHAEGDAVLQQLGEHLRKARRPQDVFCRWGGEEFLVLMVLDDAHRAPLVAERIRAQCQKTVISADKKTITFSAGLVILGEEETLEKAINRADLLLYQSKESGRDRITQG